MQSYVRLYLVPLFVHRIGNLLEYVAILFVASYSKLGRAHGADAMTEYSIS